MGKRRKRVAPPPVAEEWDLQYLDSSTEDDWTEFCRHAPGPARTAFDHLRKNARQRSERQYQLRLDLATKTIGGVEMEQWQYKPTGAGRIWYAIDDTAHTLIFTNVTIGHPKETE